MKKYITPIIHIILTLIIFIIVPNIIILNLIERLNKLNIALPINTFLIVKFSSYHIGTIIGLIIISIIILYEKNYLKLKINRSKFYYIIMTIFFIMTVLFFLILLFQFYEITYIHDPL